MGLNGNSEFANRDQKNNLARKKKTQPFPTGFFKINAWQ
jgi:hypothetical protein